MAEAFLRSLAGDRFEVASAGTEATRVHPFAMSVMSEVGIDLHGHTSKTADWLARCCGQRSGLTRARSRATRPSARGRRP